MRRIAADCGKEHVDVVRALHQQRSARFDAGDLPVSISQVEAAEEDSRVLEHAGRRQELCLGLLFVAAGGRCVEPTAQRDAGGDQLVGQLRRCPRPTMPGAAFPLGPRSASRSTRSQPICHDGRGVSRGSADLGGQRDESEWLDHRGDAKGNTARSSVMSDGYRTSRVSTTSCTSSSPAGFRNPSPNRNRVVWTMDG